MEEWCNHFRWILPSGSFGIPERGYWERHGQCCDAHDSIVTVYQAYIRANTYLSSESRAGIEVGQRHLVQKVSFCTKSAEVQVRLARQEKNPSHACHPDRRKDLMEG